MTKLAANAASPTVLKSRVPKSAIGLRGLELRRETRISTRARKGRTRPQPLGNDSAPAHRGRGPVSANYTLRVLNREFEPTAIRAREIAESRGQSLHALAHELGYAKRPPTVRQSVDLKALSRTEVARRCEYHISDISRLFAHRHPPTLTKLAKVSAAYNCWMDDVLAALGW